MINARIRESWNRLLQPLGRWLARTRLSPNAITLAGVALQVASAALIVDGRLLVAGLVGGAAALFDGFDGALARAKGIESKFGALLDSTTDRLSDALTFVPVAWLYGVSPDIAARDHSWVAAVALVALVASFLVSYVKARAEGLGYECNVGLAERAERLILINAGLILDLVPIAVTILAAASTVTFFQRILYVRARAGRVASS